MLRSNYFSFLFKLFLSGNVLYSSDGGTTFNNKEGDFPNIPVFSILHNPYESEEVIIGTELGVWRTADFSSSNPSCQLPR